MPIPTVNRDDLQRYELAPTVRFYFGSHNGEYAGSSNPEQQNDLIVIDRSTNANLSAFASKKVDVETGDGTSDEWAGAGTGFGHERPQRGDTGAKILCQLFVGLSDDPTNMTDQAEIGFTNAVDGQFDRDDICGLQVGGGTNRFRKNLGANRESVSLSSSNWGDPLDNPLDEFHVSVLLDFDNDESKLWINRQPLVDSADATITGSRPINRVRGIGGAIYGNGGSGSETLTLRYGQHTIWW